MTGRLRRIGWNQNDDKKIPTDRRYREKKYVDKVFVVSVPAGLVVVVVVLLLLLLSALKEPDLGTIAKEKKLFTFTNLARQESEVQLRQETEYTRQE